MDQSIHYFIFSWYESSFVNKKLMLSSFKSFCMSVSDITRKKITVIEYDETDNGFIVELIVGDYSEVLELYHDHNNNVVLVELDD